MGKLIFTLHIILIFFLYLMRICVELNEHQANVLNQSQYFEFPCGKLQINSINQQNNQTKPTNRVYFFLATA